MPDLESLFPQPENPGYFASVDALVDVGIPRTTVEPAMKYAHAAIEQVRGILGADLHKQFPDALERSLARMLLIGGMISWAEENRLACELQTFATVQAIKARKA